MKIKVAEWGTLKQIFKKERMKERKKQFCNIVPFIESVKMIPPVQTNNDKAILITIVVGF